MTAIPQPRTLSHLDRLEAESIHILREVAASFANPVMLYSVGKDSSVLLHLLLKAFAPATADPAAARGHALEVPRDDRLPRPPCRRDRRGPAWTNPDGVARDINPIEHGAAVHTDVMKTQGLKQALDKWKFDAAIGGARRDEEKSRAKERISRSATTSTAGTPSTSGRSCGTSTTPASIAARACACSRCPTGPSWTSGCTSTREDPGGAAVFRRAAAGGGARRRADHGRRRAPAAASGRSAAAAQRAFPHAGLLPADRRGRVAGRHAGKDHRRDAGGHHFRAPGPGDRPRPGASMEKKKLEGYF
jgi:sulfate adenylyltransferase subunit 2